MKGPTLPAAAQRSYYSGTLTEFCAADPNEIFARMARRTDFDLTGTQREAWLEEAELLQHVLAQYTGAVYLEFTIPRMGRRIDALVIIGAVIFVLEFKVGEESFFLQDLDQVVDYALDLHNFHEGSHDAYIAPVLICTRAIGDRQRIPHARPSDRLFEASRTLMKRKKRRADFHQSEPEFLISCLDRHQDWAVVICLVGGGQEINKGEAGISEWLNALDRSFPEWKIYVSDRLVDSEYRAGQIIESLRTRRKVEFKSDLHLATSMRSFRSEHVSKLVKQLLDLELNAARDTLRHVQERYPIALTRDLDTARRWLRGKARGSERYGIVVSSQAERLKPRGLDIKTPVNAVHWFLDGKDDVRSSYYLEDVATEFHVQGLEVDWACVVWDADFRFASEDWQHWSFRGTGWQHIHAPDRQRYLKNAYRVLLTRARQGMVVVVPRGDDEDPTRNPAYYDETFNYLRRSGMSLI